MTLIEDAGRPVGGVGTFWGSHVSRASASLSGLGGQSGVGPAALSNPARASGACDSKARTGMCTGVWGLGGGVLGYMH